MTPTPPGPGAGAVTASANQATSLLYEQYARRVFTFSLSRLRSREEAEDAVQTTFLYAFRSIQRGIVPRHELTWLLKIAENVCHTRRRSAWRRGRYETAVEPTTVESFPAPVTPTDELIALPEALAGMPERQRRAILLREWQGLSYQEIADELDVSQSAVETLLFRARRTLATRLEKTLKAIFGPLGFARSFLAGGGAKVTATAVLVAGTSFVALPPSDRGLADTGSSARRAAGPSSGHTASTVRGPGAQARLSAPTPGRAGAAEATRGSATRGHAHTSVGRGRLLRGARPNAPGVAPASGPQAPGKPGAGPEPQPTAGVGSGGPPTPDRPTGGTVDTPAGSADVTVSAKVTSAGDPDVTVGAGADTPAGPVEVTAGVDPRSPDPVSAEATIPDPPPLPAPPLPAAPPLRPAVP